MLKSRLVNIEINGKDKIKTLLLNTLKMLANRKLINKSDINKIHDDLSKDILEDTEYIVNTLKNKITIKYINTKLSSSYIQRLKSLLGDDTYKILIVNDISANIYKQIMEYGEVEVFWDHELMIDVISHDLVPKHILLSDEEKKQFLQAYDVKKNELPKLKITDPIARYYNMKVGDIVRIERPSITSGIGIIYRLVVSASLFNQK